MQYGEFIDAMREVANVNPGALCIFEDWFKMTTEEKWQEYRKLPLSQEGIESFVEDMATLFRDRISGTCVEKLWERRILNGHAFLRAIHAKCLELGIDMDGLRVDVPLSFSDALGSQRRDTD